MCFIEFDNKHAHEVVSEDSQEHGSCLQEKNRQNRSPRYVLEKVEPPSRRVGHAANKIEGRGHAMALIMNCVENGPGRKVTLSLERAPVAVQAFGYMKLVKA